VTDGNWKLLLSIFSPRSNFSVCLFRGKLPITDISLQNSKLFEKLDLSPFLFPIRKIYRYSVSANILASAGNSDFIYISVVKKKPAFFFNFNISYSFFLNILM